MKTVLCGWSPVTAGFPISPCDANGEAERAVDVASYAFIGDFNDTSKYGGCLPARHYGNRHGRTLLAASLHEYMHQPEVEPRPTRALSRHRQLPGNISERLCSLCDELAMRMREDDSGWQNVLKVPEALVASIDKA